MADPGLAYASGTLGTWLARGISVPLCLSHPDRELSYVLEDSGASAVIATPPHADRMRRLAEPLGAQVLEVADGDTSQSSTDLSNAVSSAVTPLMSTLNSSDGALIVYTSGTTGRPKGALHTLKSIDAQITTLCKAWEWAPCDRILHTLPLHHIHGIVNALYCPLATGAAVEMLPKFSPTEVWSHLQRDIDHITVFMGVPTMYSFLLNAYHSAPTEEQRHMQAAAQRLRLAVSGSAACPTPTMLHWRDLSGSLLLERYGMTETGMLLGNPLHGDRKPGMVGLPFQGVHARVDPATGELGVKGDQLFAGYWGRPEATAKAFDSDGYFLTGDTAEIEPHSAGGYYKLLGRTSVDIIKHGGYKISALGVESVLLEHPAIEECAVVGLPDPHYGEIVAVVAALKEGYQGELTLSQLVEWSKERLPHYQLPRIVKVVPQLPRNAMGKINKKTLRSQVFPELCPPAGPANYAAAPAS